MVYAFSMVLAIFGKDDNEIAFTLAPAYKPCRLST